MATLKEIRERLIDELQIGFYGMADSVAAGSVSWVLRFQNSNWGGNQFKNWWGHRPDRTGNDVVKAMTTLVGPALNHGSAPYTDTGASKYFSITRPDWHPTIYMLPLINRGLERSWQWWRTTLSLVPDGDMELTGLAYWVTNVNATPLKTPGGWMGTNLLQVTNSGVNGYAESQPFTVAPERSFRFNVKTRTPVGSTARPRLQVVDKSNGNVVIASVTSALIAGPWQDLQVEGTFPGGCGLAAIRLGSAGAADITLWDGLTGYWNLMTRFSLPSWVDEYRGEDGSEALRFYKYRNRLGTDGNWNASAYDLMLIDARDYQIVNQPSAVAAYPLEVEFSRDVMVDGFPIILEARRPFADFGVLAADTDTTACPLHLAVAAAKVIAGEERRELNDRLPFWTHDFQREQKRVSSLLQVPALDQPAGMAFQVWTP